MKKGEKARLDAKWWKKNKSLRLRSKTFDGLLDDYVSMKMGAIRTESPDFFDSAQDYAQRAGKEAKALVDKCGRGQNETKAVLEDYVKLFAAEIKDLAKLQDKISKTTTGIDKALVAVEKGIKQQSQALVVMNKSLAQANKVFDTYVKQIGAPKAVANFQTKIDDIGKIKKGLLALDKKADAVAGTRGFSAVKDGNKRVAAAKKLAIQLAQLASNSQKEWGSLQKRAKDAVAA